MTHLLTWKKKYGFTYKYIDLELKAKGINISYTWLSSVFVGKCIPGTSLLYVLSNMSGVPMEKIFEDCISYKYNKKSKGANL